LRREEEIEHNFSFLAETVGFAGIAAKFVCTLDAMLSRRILAQVSNVIPSVHVVLIATLCPTIASVAQW
jgi:hypothetical protein